jgi:hypothetical protein
MALLALLAATATAAIAMHLAGDSDLQWGAAAYMVAVLAAVAWPGWIPVQVVAGQVLVASVLLATPASLITAAGMVAGVVATAELLAAAHRLDSPAQRAGEAGMVRPLGAAAAGGAVFVAVGWMAGLPGPGGVTGVALAAVACAGLAVVLVRLVRGA